MEKFYNIADLVIAMDSSGRTEKQAAKYRIEENEKTDFTVKSTWELQKPKYPMLADDDGEYLSTGRSFYGQLIDYDGTMLHASAVVLDNKAYLFTANSGTGKSTHTNLWMRVFGEKAYILNDDKPALRMMDGKWYAYGTPWSGKHDISVNARVPLAGIAVVERSETNEIERFHGPEAIFAVFMQTMRTRDPEMRIKVLELMDKLISNVPVWKLRCNMEPEAAIVAYEAMSGEKWRK